MVIDASAIVAILIGEDDADELIAALAACDGLAVTTAMAAFEAATAIARSRAFQEQRPSTAADMLAGQQAVQAFLDDNAIAMADITEVHFRAAMDAAARYGRCVGHPAKLNFGDCFSYAAARLSGRRLLYKGNDFALTDLA